MDAERAQPTLLNMSDGELAELHAQGPEALKLGAWELVDREIKRRARAKARHASEEHFMEEHDEERRYPALRAIAFLLKAIAILIFLAAVALAVLALVQPTPKEVSAPLLGLLFMVAGTILAITYWASAEILVLLMDIEQNTRSRGRQ